MEHSIAQPLVGNKYSYIQSDKENLIYRAAKALQRLLCHEVSKVTPTTEILSAASQTDEYVAFQQY